MLAVKPHMQPLSPHYPLSASQLGPTLMVYVNGSPWLVDSTFWSSLMFHAPTTNRRVPDLLHAQKLRPPVYPSWQSQVGLDTLGDAVLDPAELPERRLSPIGSRRGPRRAPVAPVPQRTQARPLPKPPTVAQANCSPRELPSRPSSAPPLMQRPALARVQEVEKPAEGPAPLQDTSQDSKTSKKLENHLINECQGDPLCPTHRKRPSRTTGPHTRTPFQLLEKRPRFGERQCNDFHCTGRGCADYPYLLSRGGVLWAQLARPMIEDKLEDISLDSAYAEDTLALLRFRATFQVRRSML